jgi:hypothetical protein
MVALAMAANYGAELENILVYSASAGSAQSFAPPQGTWESFLRVRSTDNPEFVKYFFPKGAKDDGVCPLYASWNSFYRSKYTSVNRLTLKGEPVRSSRWMGGLGGANCLVGCSHVGRCQHAISHASWVGAWLQIASMQ